MIKLKTKNSFSLFRRNKKWIELNTLCVSYIKRSTSKTKSQAGPSPISVVQSSVALHCTVGTTKEVQIILRLFLFEPVQASSINHSTSHIASWLGRKPRYMQ